MHSAENHQTMTDFPKLAISISRHIRIKIVWFYCIRFVYGPSSIIKSLNKINLIEIDLQTNCQNSEAWIYKETEYKNVKNCLLLFYFRKNTLHTSRIHNTEYFWNLV